MRKYLLAATVLAAFALPATAQEVLKTGGESGDYYQFFGPPVVKLLNKTLNPAFITVTQQPSAGTPATMDYLLGHQSSYGLAQGDVYAMLSADPKYTDHFVVLATGIANEAVFAIMNEPTYQHAQGSWGAVIAHAERVHFVMPPPESGPGRTWQALVKQNPDTLGAAKNVSYAPSLDAAIEEVARESPGNAVSLGVQFGNPKNPRFERMAQLGLHVVPVLTGSMRDLKLPDGAPAYTFCSDVQVAEKTTINTACSPVLVITGKDNKDLTTVKAGFANVTAATFEPPVSGIAALWRKVKATSGEAFNKGVAAANDLARKAADNM